MIPPHAECIDGIKISDLLDTQEEKTKYARRIERKFPIEEYLSMPKCTECPCEPTFTLNGKIHFLKQEYLFSKTNIKMQKKLAKNKWDRLKSAKVHCEKHTLESKTECPITKQNKYMTDPLNKSCQASNIEKENEFILQQNKFLSRPVV
jgi:hypothetical protein